VVRMTGMIPPMELVPYAELNRCTPHWLVGSTCCAPQSTPSVPPLR
jgi:hypothetical protein